MTLDNQVFILKYTGNMNGIEKSVALDSDVRNPTSPLLRDAR